MRRQRIVGHYQHRCGTIGEKQARQQVVQGGFLLEMKRTQFRTHDQHLRSRGSGEGMSKLQRMHRGITAHKVYGRTKYLGRQAECFDELQVQTRRTHTRTAYRDQMSDRMSGTSVPETSLDGL